MGNEHHHATAVHCRSEESPRSLESVSSKRGHRLPSVPASRTLRPVLRPCAGLPFDVNGNMMSGEAERKYAEYLPDRSRARKRPIADAEGTCPRTVLFVDRDRQPPEAWADMSRRVVAPRRLCRLFCGAGYTLPPSTAIEGGDYNPASRRRFDFRGAPSRSKHVDSRAGGSCSGRNTGPTTQAKRVGVRFFAGSVAGALSRHHCYPAKLRHYFVAKAC